MLRLVAYDITEPKRLRLVAKACEDYGFRIEKSVFECDLNESDYTAFWTQLQGLIDEKKDSLVSYRICKSCQDETDFAGVLKRPKKQEVYLF